MTKETIKTKLLHLCQFYIDQRVGVAQNAIDRAKEGIENETKSAMGDKHETGRVNMQNDQNNHAQQLSESLKLQMLLDRIDPEVLHQKITFGSVVFTDQGNYFVAISAGRLVLDDEKFFAISPQTPLAREFLQKSKGDIATFNDKPIRILDVF